MINMEHLNEPSILHVLDRRFAADVVYTFTGPVLLAVNPFKPLTVYDEPTLRS